jgi:hypothetical protein
MKAFLFQGVFCAALEPLRFNGDGVLKIAFFTDLHYGESELMDLKSDEVLLYTIHALNSTVKAFNEDFSAAHQIAPALFFFFSFFQVQRTVLENGKSDFIVFNGDMVSGWNAWGCIAPTAIQWASTISKDLPIVPTAMAFVHIPIAQAVNDTSIRQQA